jgi:hypothetical protein
LRHSHETWLIAGGAPEIAQARRLGHHLDDRVIETYSHVAPEVEQRLLEGNRTPDPLTASPTGIGESIGPRSFRTTCVRHTTSGLEPVEQHQVERRRAAEPALASYVSGAARVELPSAACRGARSAAIADDRLNCPTSLLVIN